MIFAGLTSTIRLRAQTGVFSSGSTGSDGALNITAAGVTWFDPVALNIDPKRDNIFNFTTVTVAHGSILKISEAKVHGPVYFLAQGDVVINGVIDITGQDSPGPTTTAAEQSLSFAGSGGYSGGLGGIHGDSNHQALPGNGPAGGAAGDINSPSSNYASGGGFSTNRFLVPLVGGSGGGGTNDNGQYGAQGGAGGGALMIASSTKIVLDSTSAGGYANNFVNGVIYAYGGSGGGRGCGGAGGAVRLIANSIIGQNNNGININAGGGSACKVNPQPGLARVEANTISWGDNYGSGPVVTSVPFALNLPSVPPPVLTVTSINGVAINANPFSFPDTTINTSSPVPVVIGATNVPIASTVTLYLISDVAANQAIPVTLTGTDQSSTATVSVTFPSGGSRGFVKAVFH